MAIIPTYEAKVGLDPSTKGMPKPVLSSAEESAAYAQGQSLQGVGSALTRAGLTALEVEEHKIRRAEQDENTRTSLNFSNLVQSQNSAIEASREKMAPDGTNFSKERLAEFDKAAGSFLSSVPVRLQEEYKLRLEGQKQAFGQRANSYELNAAQGFARNTITTLTDRQGQTVEAQPESADHAIKELTSVINNTRLTPAEKLQQISQMRANILASEARGKYGRDPEEMAAKMGRMPPPSERAVSAMSFFKGKGLSAAQAAGIVGNLQAESGLNTSARNPGDGSDGSDSVGMAQWNSGRAVALRAFAAARGKAVSDFDTQLEFVWHELNTSHSGALAKLRSAKNVAEATAAIVTDFERPKGSDQGAQNAHNWSGRLRNAQVLAGVAIDPRYSELDSATKDRLVSGAQKIAGQERTIVQAAMNDDLASIQRTGMPTASPALTPENVSRVMGADAALEWQSERARAQNIFTALDGIGSLSPAEIAARIERLRPVPGSPGFVRDEQIFTHAQKEGERVIAANSSAAKEKIERDFVEAKRGAIPLPPRSTIENNPMLTEAARTPLLKTWDSQNEQEMKVAGASVRIQGGQHDNAGFTKAAQDDVNTVAGAIIPTPASLFDQSQEGAARRAQVTQIAQRVGYVPQVAVQMIQSGFNSADPARVETAANLASQIIAANPNAFAASGAREQIQQQTTAFDFYVNKEGMQPRKAAELIAQENDPEWKKKLKKGEDEVKSYEKKLKDDNAVNELRGGILGFGAADLSYTQRGIQTLESEFIMIAGRRYAEHGNEQLAKEQARAALLGDPSKGIRGTYAPTWFNGRKTLMQYAPEAAPGYPPMPDGTWDYVYLQAQEHIKATTGKDISREKLMLEPLGRDTGEAFRRDLPVPYRLLYWDDKGMLQQARDSYEGRRGWFADPAKAHAAFGAKAQAGVDQDVGTWATQMGASPAVAADPRAAREFIAARQAETRAEVERQARERAPGQAAELERGRSLARESMANQMPDEVPRAGFIPPGAGNDDARRRMQEEELRRSRELGRGARDGR